MFEGIQIYHNFFDSIDDIANSTFTGNFAEWTMIYLVLTLTTTLWGTIPILYCIISVARGVQRIHLYHGVIEALIESAALYSAILIIDIVFVACDILNGGYTDVLAAAIRVCLLHC